jgi:Trp operon repressor
MIIKNPDGSMRLVVLDSFVEDRTLPKFKNDDSKQAGAVYLDNVNAVRFSTGSDIENSPIMMTSSGFVTVNKKEQSTFDRFVKFIKHLFKPKPVKVEKIFNLILKNKQEIDIVTTRIEGFIELIRRAKDNGQVALVEKLEKQLPVKLLEQKLFVSDFKKFIDEQDLIKFVIKCEKGLKLSYVKNFMRQIPKEVTELKKKADELEVFDNYVILHYDPDGKATEMTEKEKEKAKDPILFGLIRNSTKLYFIGDWKDELCDLTFEEIAKKLSPNTETEML